MKRLTTLNKTWEIIIGVSIALILLLTLPLQGCKSVQKTQSEKTESATVSKSDSSSSKSYSYTDTTKTDSSTEVTTTTVTIDSVEYDYIPKGDLSGNVGIQNYGISHNISGQNVQINVHKAKGIKITTTTTKQAAIEAKGVTIKQDVKQADIKTEEKFAKRELSKETTKKPSISMGVGLVFGMALLLGLIWLVIWVWRKKKAAITTIAGKVF